MTTDAERIIADPIAVVIGGTEYPLKFDFLALMKIEERFDGLLHFTDALNSNWRKKRLTAIHAGLVAALAHAGMTPRDVDKITAHLVGDGFKDIASVADALNAAFDQAIPAPAKSKTPGKV
jgi:3-oxoacyl-(acyl-carrier-protein) synthase